MPARRARQGLEAALAASLIGSPGARPMPGHPERRYQHQVESQVEPGEIGARQQEGLRGAGDPPPLPRRQRRCRRVEFVSRLDLDDREHAAATRQDVDLARGATPAAGEDAPAPQPQMPQAQPFGETPAALRPLPPLRGRSAVPVSFLRRRASPRRADRVPRAAFRSRPRVLPPPRARRVRRAAVRSRSSTSAWSGSARSGGPTTTTASPRGGPARR